LGMAPIYPGPAFLYPPANPNQRYMYPPQMAQQYRGRGFGNPSQQPGAGFVQNPMQLLLLLSPALKSLLLCTSVT
jgi:hypothetical protein